MSTLYDERTEKHLLSPSSPFFSIFLDFCHKSKNLYNYATYKIRDKYSKEGKWLRYQDLDKELRNFRLDHLFDEVIHIDKDTDKSSYIKNSKAIFIDDSNAERVNIKSQLNIPVFSPDMIDVLT